MRTPDTWPAEGAFVSEVLHGLSQPLTALECGLELSLRQDSTVAELRNRMEALRGTVGALHQQLLELRALQNAANPGNTTAPVAAHVLLQQLREDLLPVAELSQIGLRMQCRPALVYGNAEKLRNGLFRLLEFLMRQCPSGGSVSITGRRGGAKTLELAFRVSGTPDDLRTGAAASTRELDWRIAQRTFVAAGGRMEALPTLPGSLAGVVTLQALTEVGE
jgi:hypothetical protein